MATLDTLPPQRRAIIELLLRQKQGYDDVASMLDIPSARVRELAREALSSLAPSTARRVDDDWRDQVADYVLGQQTGPESKATRGHLKHSEPARAWVSSLLDSLDPLYGDGDRPDIPSPEDGAGRQGDRRRRGAAGAAAAAGGGAAAGAAAGRAGRDRTRRGGDGRADREDGEPEQTTGREAAPEGEEAAVTEEPRGREEASRPRERPRQRKDLSPEARAAVRRRRLIGAGAVVAVLAIALAIILLSGGDDEEGDRASRPPAGQSQQQQAQLVGQARLEPVGGSDAQGVAVIAERTGQFQLLVQARGLEPSGRGAAYEVWLYNTKNDAVSLGGQVTDNDGNLQGAGPLPPNFRTYRFVDISREKIDRNSDHSGTSVLRIPMPDLLRGRPAGAGGAGGAAP